MRLSDLLDDLSVLDLVAGPADGEVLDIVADHRSVRPGSMFACVRGNNFDGHRVAVEAVAAGAVAVLSEEPLSLPAGVAQIVVADVRTSIGPIADRLASAPSSKLRIVGITGTNGKTTVAHLVESIATRSGGAPAVLGTLGARWGGKVVATGFTTPEAPELQRLFASMVDDGVDIVAMEVSSHALAMHRVDGTRFGVVGFTNLTAEHLDLHGSLDAYFAAKARLFTTEFAERAVIAIDDEWGVALVARARAAGVDVTTVSTSTERRIDGVAADIAASEVAIAGDGSTFLIEDRRRGSARRVSIGLLGRYNIANALVADALCAELGISSEARTDGLAHAARVPGRLEPVANTRGLTVLVDYAHTPDALATVLANLRELAAPPARLIAVYGCGGDRDRTKRGPMGRAVAQHADVALLTTDNPRSEAPEAIIAEVIAGLAPADRRPRVVVDRAAAIAEAIGEARAGDVVAILGKGHETGQSIAGTTYPFDDREVAREALGMTS